MVFDRQDLLVDLLRGLDLLMIDALFFLSIWQVVFNTICFVVLVSQYLFQVEIGLFLFHFGHRHFPNLYVRSLTRLGVYLTVFHVFKMDPIHTFLAFVNFFTLFSKLPCLFVATLQDDI